MKRRAKITVELDRLGWTRTFEVEGTEDEIFFQAMTLTHDVAQDFIDENDIDSDWEQGLIFADAFHIIEWEDCRFAYTVIDRDAPTEKMVIGIFRTRAEAEEALFNECEDYVYETMMTCDPIDIIGREWIYPRDWKYLMKDCSYCFVITEAPVYP